MTFTGFESSAADFLAALAKDNSRDYFDAHRQTYIDSIRQPLEDLLGQAESVYGPGKAMRPNRDVRFSRDKSPYRTTAGMWAGEVAGVYLSVTATHLELGGGIYEPGRDQLARAREAIDSVPQAATKLAAVVARLERAGFEMAGPSLTTAPRGFGVDHPHIELLRLKHYAALTTVPVTASPDEIFAKWKAVEPLIAWGDTYVKAGLARP